MQEFENPKKFTHFKIHTQYSICEGALKIDDLNIQVCHRSLMYLIGTEIVWEESPMGGGLTYINPNEGAQCG